MDAWEQNIDADMTMPPPVNSDKKQIYIDGGTGTVYLYFTQNETKGGNAS